MQPDTILPFFAKFIETELGIVYAEHNYYQLQNRLEEIAKLVGVADVKKLYEQAQSGISGAFKQLLLDIATNNETSFFRDPKIFKAIESVVLASFKENSGPTDKLHIWSAASSTGQEAISTCIAINEWNQKTGANISYSIKATDISERVLERAKTAQYSQLEVQRGLPATFLVKYFKKQEGDKWLASAELTKNIEYKKLNLKDTFTFTQPFNLIMCRNVLIYQSVEGKIEILNRMTKLLAPGGFLILGSGESLLGLSTEYEQCNIEGVVVYRKKANMLKAA